MIVTPGEEGHSTTNEPGTNAAPSLATTLDADPADPIAGVEPEDL